MICFLDFNKSDFFSDFVSMDDIDITSRNRTRLLFLENKRTDFRLL